MSRWLNTSSYILICIGFLVVFISLNVSGCDKVSEEKELNRVIYALNKISNLPWLPTEEKNRVNSAISKWKNGTLDTKPILITATLTRPVGVAEINLSLVVFDEDQDVIGFSIKETHIRADGQRKVIEENYPAYIHYPLYRVANVWFVGPVDIRDDDERKDEELWQKYVDGSGEITSIKGVKNYDFPPVLVSIPEPNEVEVTVWIYDKEGNKSKSVKLLNLIDYSVEKGNKVNSSIEN